MTPGTERKFRILCERLRAANDRLTFSRTMLQGLRDKGA
jgi:hypothetical protein